MQNGSNLTHEVIPIRVDRWLVVPLIESKHFRRAVKNIALTGDTDIFPLPFENHVLHDLPDKVCNLLETVSAEFDVRLSQSPPVTNSALAQVGYNGFRWATQIDPMWNAYFLGLVISLANDIEQVRIPATQNVVFSHRFDDSESVHLFNRDGWTQFRDESLRLASEFNYVVSIDIADFYGRLYHHRIENELKYIDRDGARARQIIKLLRSFSNNVSYGLPVGGPAARILSELVLNSVDKVIQAQLVGAKFTRYADDYRFFVNDIEAAYRVVGFMSEKLQRNEGLSLQRSKTRIMTSNEFVEATSPGDPRPGSAEKFLSLHLYYDPYSPTAEDDYEALRGQLTEFDVLGLLRSELFKGRIDVGLTRRLMSAIKLMDSIPKEQAIRSLLENIETLAPIIPSVIRVVRANLDALPEDAQQETFAVVRGLITSGHHLAQVDVSLAYMVWLLADDDSQETNLLLGRLFDRAHGYSNGPAPNIQRDIVLALARHGTTWWLHDRKPHVPSMHSWVQRSFILGSYALGDEGRHWRLAQKSAYSEFDAIVAEWAAARFTDTGWQAPL